MANPLSSDALSKIFKKSSRNPDLIGTNEGICVEYKESFGWKSLSEYFRAMAAFANRDGGYIVFGVVSQKQGTNLFFKIFDFFIYKLL